MRWAVIALALLALAGCGKSGGQDEGPPPKAVVDSTVDLTVSPDTTMEVR